MIALAPALPSRHPIMTEQYQPLRLDVAILGLGQMGAACAQTLLRKGHRVAVWNRTRRPGESCRTVRIE
jgi:glutamyl-tRNA reductase